MLRHTLRIVLGVLVLACQAAPPPETAPSAGPASAAAPVTSAPTATPTAAPASAASAPPPGTGLPGYTAQEAGPDAQKQATEANRAGFRAYRKGDLTAAAAEYERAVRAHPGHALARYNLACVWARLGQAERALAALRELREAGCPTCLARVAGAPADEDWAALKADPRFVAVTQGVVVPAGPGEVSAALERAFTTGKVEALSPFLSDEGTVEVVTVCSVCDPPEDRATKKLARGALVKHIARAANHGGDEENAPYFNGFERPKCDDTCCRAHPEMLMHNNLFLEEVCVRRGPDGAPKLSRLVLIDGA
jgi:hypothetical protein